MRRFLCLFEESARTARRFFALLTALVCLPFASALCAEDLTPYFDEALATLQTPAQLGAQSGSYALYPGDQTYFPYLFTEITPFDQRETTPPPVASGTFSSSDPGVVDVDASGLMTAAAPGEAAVTWHTDSGDLTLHVGVSLDNTPELIKNYVYVLNREFYTVRRARLPKYNQYAKWYYKRKKEVGWCAVFTIYCANAAGIEPIEEEQIDAQNVPTVQMLKEGQVGNQYDGYMEMNRFVGVPKPGYLVIYADMNNAYRTVHIGSVVNVEDRGDGIYAVTTVEGNMSNSVKSYCYLYDSGKDNHLVGVEKGAKLKWNMAALEEDEQTDPLVQYKLHTDHWAVFGFCQTWN